MDTPPQDITSCIGIICNGEIETTSKEKINQCRYIIGVDGGLYHCDEMQIAPNWIVGDFDSVNSVLMQKFQAHSGSSILPRAKDCTDLEAAIEKAKSISPDSHMIVWGGLGGRIDHALGNIFLLTRHPGRLFLESEQQVLFGINHTLGEIDIDHKKRKTLAIFPLSGPATNVTIKNGDHQVVLPLVDRCRPILFPIKGRCSISIEAGDLLVILDRQHLEPLNTLADTNIQANYSLQQPLIRVFEYLAHQSMHDKTISWLSDKERICILQPDSGEVHFPSTRGQIISLIPLFGPATGLKTKGLKWDLGENTVSTLDKNFVGTSNVSMGEAYSISVGSGQLICIVNEHLIDTEMVGLTPSTMKLSDPDWDRGVSTLTREKR